MTAPATAPPAPARREQRLAVVAALTTVVLWASAFVGIRVIGETYSPGALAFGRVATGALALGVIALLYRSPPPRGRALVQVIAYGAAWFAGYTAVLNLAERYLDAGTAAMLVNFAPILVAVFAGLFMGEGFPRALVAGIMIAFTGVVVIAVGGSGGGHANEAVGVWLGLLTAVLYASGVILQKFALRRVGALSATWAGCAAGAVVLLPFAPQFVAETATASGGALAGVIYLGVFPTAIAFTTWAYALARTTAGRMAATSLSIPAVTILMSWLLLGELPTVLGMLGGGLCLLGVAVSRRR